jgi:prolipoprotein diacylglyceryltransferase
MVLLEAAEPAGFLFWFLTELFFAGVVVFLLYYFIVKNPKINKNSERHEEED